MMNGKLVTVFSNVFKEEERRSEITAFRIDKRHRKAYVANNHGEIFVINCQNGVILKNVTQYLEDQKNINRYMAEKEFRKSMSSLGSSKHHDSESDNNEMDIYKDTPLFERQQKQKQQKAEKDDSYSDFSEDDAYREPEDYEEKNPEITDLILIWEDEMIMMICSNSKEYMVYDERDGETSKLLRRVSGGHKEEITILAYDHYLSAVATGCINGEICLFDFELSKIEGMLLGHTGDITALEFMSPYPFLISSSMDCTVCIWGIRPCPSKL